MEQELQFEQPTLEAAQPDLEQVIAAAASAPDALLGKILGGHYQIESRLGSGGMSVVYKARHLLLDKFVAIKVVSTDRTIDGKSIQRFAQEARAAANLSHPNIVAAREFGIDQDGHPFLVMDFVEGESLEKIIEREGKIETTRAFDIIAQVCDALMHAHEKGIVHRDIKPGNIIVSQEGGKEIARILDFGIAKITNQAEGQALTQTGEVFGSPLYMSPEQCHGKKLDARSDIYSLGCVIAEMLTGKKPFVGQSALETLVKHIEAEPELDPSLSQTVEKLILKSLEKDVTKRYQSIAELARDLDAAEASLSDPSDRRKKRRRRVKTKSRWSKKERIIAWCLVSLCAIIAAVGAGTNAIYTAKPAWQVAVERADYYQYHRNTPEAAEFFRRALELAQKEHDGKAAEQLVRQEMAEFYLYNAQRDQNMHEANLAKNQINEALRIIGNNGNAYQKAHVLDNLGEVENFLHEYGAAEAHYKDAVNFRDADKEHPRMLAGTLVRQGINYQDEKKYDLALQSCLDAVDVLRRMGEKSYIVNCYSQLAEIESEKKDYVKAISYYDECMKLMESRKADERWHDILSHKADVLDKLGKTSEAAALRAQLK